ncbi:MAG: antitoxin HicB [bacterium]|nr:antitoxin HicB [bacterium]
MAEKRYRYWTEWSEEDGEWVGLCDGFPLVSWLDPDRDRAEAGIRDVIAEVIEDLVARGRTLPRPGVQQLAATGGPALGG